MNYGLKLKEIRLAKNLSQKDLADILHLSDITYSHYETQDNIIPIKHLNTLCNYLKVSIDYVFGFSDKESYKNSKKQIDLYLSGVRLKEFRKENNLTQLHLATFLNTDNSTISKYEKGVHIISTSFLYAICQKYKVSADYLLGKIDK